VSIHRLGECSKIAGHADPKTTARYDRRSEQAKQHAAEKPHFPFRGATITTSEPYEPQDDLYHQLIGSPLD
jgi:hypothetical protein